ncbi:hypothetical protein PENTCL1PPCAC_28322, partial [Pristionchus entomophagus]
IEHVDHEDALHRMSMDVAQYSHLEIAEGYSGEHARLLPFDFVHQILEEREAIGEVVRPEEMIEQEELEEDIGRVEDLDPDIQHGHVASAVPAATRAHLERGEARPRVRRPLDLCQLQG